MGKSMKKRKINGDSLQAMAMLAPMMIGFFIFTYIPIIYILRYSFYESNGIKAAWTGMDNFVRIFTRDSAYWKSLGNVFLLAFGKLAVEIPLSLFLAVLLNKGLKATGFDSVTAATISSKGVAKIVNNAYFFLHDQVIK